MKINDAGLKLLKSFEGCKLSAYPDPGTGGDPWTIGYGATGPDVEEGILWTQAQADRRLAQDLIKFESGVSSLLKVVITRNEFSALVCFAYNVGLGNLKSSTLLAKINEGSISEAANQFLRWDASGGHHLPGLMRRRQAERTLFLSS